MRFGKTSTSKQDAVLGNGFSLSHAIPNKLKKIHEDIGKTGHEWQWHPRGGKQKRWALWSSQLIARPWHRAGKPRQGLCARPGEIGVQWGWAAQVPRAEGVEGRTAQREDAWRAAPQCLPAHAREEVLWGHRKNQVKGVRGAVSQGSHGPVLTNMTGKTS